MLENRELFKLRARAANSDRQHNRMIMDKLRGFHRALLYSYQAAWIKRDFDMEAQWVRALINPDKVKFDYDEKIVSVDWIHGFKPGDTFEWGRGTGSHWIILKPEDTELAYLRANVRRCKYVEARDPETHQSFGQWMAIRGPVETKINTIQKAGLVADVPNHTLDIYMTDTFLNRRTFTRYSRFEYDGIYWKVTAFDYISTPGIIEITAQEDYECHNDEMFIIAEPIENPVDDNVNEILGNNAVKPLEPSVFTVKFKEDNCYWTITLPASKNKEVNDVLDYRIIENNAIEVTWTAMRSGSYILHYGDLDKTVNVESLF